MPKIDHRELIRFVITGGIATVGNMSTVWVARGFVSFQTALIFGIAAGMSFSFLLSKFFAFRSRQWSSAAGEAYRFLIVYGFGLIVYWLAAVWMRAVLRTAGAPLFAAEMVGVLCGAGLMVVTGYFGHRFFTYRTGQTGDVR